MASEFTLESLREFMVQNGGKVKNHELVTHFKSFLNDPAKKDERRDQFKTYVNTLATIKVDEQNDKILVLKKKYRPDSGGGGGNQDVQDFRAQSEPPGRQERAPDIPDGGSMSRSTGNLSASDLKLSQSTLSSAGSRDNLRDNGRDNGRGDNGRDNVFRDNASITSSVSSSSLANPVDEQMDASVISVKDRAKHLNRIESESDIQKTSTSSLSATRKKDYKKSKQDVDDDESTGSGYVILEPIEKEWLVTSSAADYHPMHQLLSKHPNLARVKDFTSTALHWAAKYGRAEVIKMLVGKPGVHVNQRTGYTPLHLAAMHGHEDIIELLIQGYKADPNIRDYSGKKPKQYLKNSASSRVQHLMVSSRLGSKANQERIENNFMRNTSGRKSNRASAIKSLIQMSTVTMKQTIRSRNSSSEDLSRRSPSMSRHSAEPSPRQRRKGSFSKDREMMPPPSGAVKTRRPPHSISKESLFSDDKRMSVVRQVPRSESEPNLGDMVQPSKSTFI